MANANKFNGVSGREAFDAKAWVENFLSKGSSLFVKKIGHDEYSAQRRGWAHSNAIMEYDKEHGAYDDTPVKESQKRIDQANEEMRRERAEAVAKGEGGLSPPMPIPRTFVRPILTPEAEAIKVELDRQLDELDKKAHSPMSQVKDFLTLGATRRALNKLDI